MRWRRSESLPLNIVGYFKNARLINGILEKLNPTLAARVINVERNMNFMLALKERIDAGEMVALLADRVGLGDRVVEVELFGAPALLPAGPYWLAASLRCPVYLTFGLFHEPNRYDLYCEPFAERIELRRGERDSAARGVGAAVRGAPGALLPPGARQLVQLLPGLEGARVTLEQSEVVFGGRPVTLEQICDVAQGRAQARLNAEPEYRARLEASRASLERQLRAGRVIYGVTTGVGESCENQVPPELTDELSTNLFRFHGVGTGAPLSDEEAAAVVAARLASLACGHSGVRPLVLDRLVVLLENEDPAPHPRRGLGRRQRRSDAAVVRRRGARGRARGLVRGRGDAGARSALERCGLAPLTLRPKEALALMNGTSVMTGLAVPRVPAGAARWPGWRRRCRRWRAS